ncbi:aminoglycoside 6'-N-acetyltransferase [Paenibacillus camelliae]|uniref:aminoglycoside 6'-N-acetyltransferase n=1 Tax=Paenibacillus camelliae TaxID=512410 RepID=UPI00203DA242|nr:aminoglycoside 6'-N-acetyltransferase [Paenibacillus camelliae]MCM3633614.1 GNAT family N-acetyltransferase [Paenibacillus camelliae]
MIIEKANKKNLDEVTSLAIKLWPENIWSALRAEFEKQLDSKKDVVYLAITEGRYVGFIHMSLRYDYVEGSSTSPVGYIEGIYVDENYRNKGISKMLVEAGEIWSKSLGCTEIASDTELHNVGSQQFHERMGFKEVAKIVAFIKTIK